MASLEKLPLHHQISGKFRENEAIQTAISEYYNSLREGRHFEEEIPHSPERLKQLAKMREAMLTWGKDLGYDLNERLPLPEHYHYFANQDDLKAAVRSLGIEPHEGQLGGSTTAGMLLIDSHESNYDPLAITRHETIHDIAGQRHKLEQRDDGSFDITDPAPFITALNEMFTDIIAIDIAVRYERAEVITAQYTSLDMIGDELIKKIGQELDEPPLKILQEIERIYITADTNALLKFARVIPLEARQALIKATHMQDTDMYIDLADKLDLPAAKEKIVKAENGETNIAFLAWLNKDE